MQSLEKTDKENFENIVKTQDQLSEKLHDLSENVKNLAVNDKSQVFRRAYPARSSIDSCNEIKYFVDFMRNCRDFGQKP